jgi:hypothetical protein
MTRLAAVIVNDTKYPSACAKHQAVQLQTLDGKKVSFAGAPSDRQSDMAVR